MSEILIAFIYVLKTKQFCKLLHLLHLWFNTFSTTYVTVILIVQSFRTDPIDGRNADILAFVHMLCDHLHSLHLVPISRPAESITDAVLCTGRILWQTYRSDKICHLHRLLQSQQGQHTALHWRLNDLCNALLLLPRWRALYANCSQFCGPFCVRLTLSNTMLF
jgi:hypothetical protein